MINLFVDFNYLNCPYVYQLCPSIVVYSQAIAQLISSSVAHVGPLSTLGSCDKTDGSTMARDWKIQNKYCSHGQTQPALDQTFILASFKTIQTVYLRYVSWI